MSYQLTTTSIVVVQLSNLRFYECAFLFVCCCLQMSSVEILPSDLKGSRGKLSSRLHARPMFCALADSYSPVRQMRCTDVSLSGNLQHTRRLKRARADEKLLLRYKWIHYRISLLCAEQESKLERSMQSLLDISHPLPGDLLWDCKLSETGQWQRARTTADTHKGAIGEVIANDKEAGRVTCRIFSERSNPDIDSVRIVTGEISLPVQWCKCRIRSL
jgi:hypothetical protein